MSDQDSFDSNPADLNVRAQAATRRRARQVLAPTQQMADHVEVGPQSNGIAGDPAYNPEWSKLDRMTPDIRIPTGVRTSLVNLSRLERDESIGIEHKPSNLLDEQIFTLRQAGHQPGKIADIIGGRMTEAHVRERLAGITSRMSQFTDEEMRMLQLGRLESLIGFMWQQVESGSADHAKIMLEGIDRISKLLDLDKQKVRIKVELVSHAQAAMIGAVVQATIAVLLDSPRLAGVLDRNELEGLAGQAMDAAILIIDEARSDEVVVSGDNADKDRIVVRKQL
jgi:hypothetical protein